MIKQGDERNTRSEAVTFLVGYELGYHATVYVEGRVGQ